ncbi:MAG: LPS-assembly protein LptD [Nitrospinae bacterium]|nr:LPS-assembly protein LptD [Nitrospinota bacterium]
MNTHEGLMDGDVSFKMPGADLKAQMMEFNLNNGLGTLTDVKGTIGDGLSISAQKVERTGERSFSISDGAITSCPPDYQEWVFKAKSLDVTMGGLASFRDVSLRFYDVPVFYSPYWFAPAVTERTSGLLLPGAGYSSTSGAFMNNSYYWAISGQDDATLYFDVMSLRGTHEGVEYRYVPAERTHGQMKADYMKDALYGEALWSVKYNHSQQLSDHLDALANLDMESRVSYTKEFSTDNFMKTRLYTDSNATLTSRSDAWYLSLTGRDQTGIEETPTEIFSRKPEMGATMLPRSFLNTPVVVNGDAAVTSFFSSRLAGDQNLDRAVFHPVVSSPFTLGRFLNLYPWANGYALWYSNGQAGAGPISTAYYSAGLGAEGPRMYRIYESDSDSYKHTVTPQLDYSYVPGFELNGVDRANTVKLDALDYSTPQSLLTFTLLNRVFSRKQDDEIFWASLKQGYDFNEARRTDATAKFPYTDLQLDIKSKPASWLLFNMDMTYNHYISQPDTMVQELGFAPSGSSFYLSYDRNYSRLQQTIAVNGLITYSPTPTIFSTGMVGYRLSERFSTEVSGIYDEYQHRYNGTLFLLKFQSCCWGASLSAGTRPRTISLPDGSLRQESETRFYVSINLKGLGDIGEKPSPLIQRKL